MSSSQKKCVHYVHTGNLSGFNRKLESLDNEEKMSQLLEALFVACIHNYIKIFEAGLVVLVELLNLKNPEIEFVFASECRDSKHWQLVHYICYYGRVEMLTFFLEQCTRDTSGFLAKSLASVSMVSQTPLYVACDAKASACVSLLLQCGLDIQCNTADMFGLTPFHLACSKGYVECVNVFLETICKRLEDVNMNATHITTHAYDILLNTISIASLAPITSAITNHRTSVVESILHHNQKLFELYHIESDSPFCVHTNLLYNETMTLTDVATRCGWYDIVHLLNGGSSFLPT